MSEVNKHIIPLLSFLIKTSYLLS